MELYMCINILVLTLMLPWFFIYLHIPDGQYWIIFCSVLLRLNAMIVTNWNLFCPNVIRTRLKSIGGMSSFQKYIYVLGKIESILDKITRYSTTVTDTWPKWLDTWSTWIHTQPTWLKLSQLDSRLNQLDSMNTRPTWLDTQPTWLDTRPNNLILNTRQKVTLEAHGGRAYSWVSSCQGPAWTKGPGFFLPLLCR